MTRVLDPMVDQLPTVRAPETACASGGPSVHRPFVMRLAAVPAVTAPVDSDALVFDERRQIMLMRDGSDLAPAFKHTSTQTSTSTGDQDRSGPDTDTDATGT